MKTSMKTIKFLTLVLFASLVFTSCSDDDDHEEVHEEELITTVIVTLTPNGGGTDIVFKSTDLDGDGPNPPVIENGGSLTAGVTYMGSIEFWNEAENPAEDITEEIAEEDDEHQVFYTTSANLDATTTYNDQDGNGNPVGLDFDLTANAISGGTLTVTLRHEPNKPNTGLADAGGSTDAEIVFTVAIQ